MDKGIDMAKVSNYTDEWTAWYDFGLAARFASDYKIPIDGCDEMNFRHSLGLYEGTHGARTKWCNLVCNINRLYEGQDFAQKASRFLQEYYETRDSVIRSVEQSDAFKEFNNLKELPFKSDYMVKPVCGSKGIYNMQNVGKRFISIDMRNANFQTLQKCGVIMQETYRDFLAQFCSGFMLDYISESKYSRQVIFGKLNPARTITVEKNLMKSLAEHVERTLLSLSELKMAAFNSDEIVYCFDGDDSLYMKILDICNDGMFEPALDLKIEWFTLQGYEFSAVRKSDGTKHKLGEFYHRSIDPDGIYKGMPLPFHKYLTRLMRGEAVVAQDRRIMQSGCEMELLDDLVIDEIRGQSDMAGESE